MYDKAKLTALMVLAGLLCLCKNPFLPPTGVPVNDIQLRETPAGVIKQLEIAYEQKRIDLFTELLLQNFRFYIEPETEEILSRPYVSADDSLRNNLSLYPYIAISNVQRFHFWGFASEKKSHEKLFREAETIIFVNSLSPDEPRYFVDTLYNADSTVMSLDTIRAEVVVPTGGRFEISVPEIRPEPFDVDVGTQVFYMIPDPADKKLWVILKWFDLGQGY